MIRVSIIGATGYVGLELVRLLTTHGEVKIQHLVSSSSAGEDMSRIYPQLIPFDLPVLEKLDIQAISDDTDVFFVALPHGVSQDVIIELFATGKKIIDMSADFRYDDPTVYGAWYGRHHAPELLKKSVYGLPELYREAIQKTQLLANPGCYTTCSILALAPLLKEHLVDPESILIDAKSGVSGAGRKIAMTTQFCEVEGDVKAYSVGVHRHTSEIEQELGKLYGADITLSFTPHLVPIKRGILATCYAKLTSGKNSGDLVRLYRAFYKDEPFMTLFEESELPQIKDVVGSNRVAIGLAIDQRTKRVVVVSCLDNLVKGAAGQAVQNFNLMNGLPETTGLEGAAWYL